MSNGTHGTATVETNGRERGGRQGGPPVSAAPVGTAEPRGRPGDR
ncbi:hypothetical protein [Haloplanus pelagicus]|nr:hypothetical protein [Haloplanus sp. HW8-1]